MSQKSQFSPTITSFPSSPSSFTRNTAKPSVAVRATTSAHQGLNILNLFIGLTIIGTEAAAIAVFRQTYDPSTIKLLPLWPAKFNLGPSIACLVAGCLVVVGSLAVLVVSKIPSLSNKPILRTATTALGSGLALAAAITATALYYAVNNSRTVDTLQSWTCRWAKVDMDTAPHWGSLCAESKAALYLTVLMVPLEVIALGMLAVGYGKSVKRDTEEKGGESPALS